MSETNNHNSKARSDPHEITALLLNSEENSTEDFKRCEENHFPIQNDHHKSFVQNSSAYSSFIGAVMAVVSSLCFSICSLIVKYLKNVDPFELSTVRFTGMLLPTTVIVLWVNENPLGPREKRCILLLRAVCGALSLMLQFYAIRHMPLADASVIIFSAPVFVAISARIFLKEYFGIFNIIMIILTIFGVVFITRPPFLFGSSVYEVGYTNDMIQGAIAALIGTLFNANVYVLLRHLKDVHYSVVMLTFSVIAIIMSAISTFIFGELSDIVSVNDYLLIGLVAVFSFGGQILLTKALHYEQAGPVAIYRTTDILFAFIWQSIFFKEVPNVYSVCGAILVSTSVILTGLKKWLMTSPYKSKLSERFKCFQWC